MNALASLAPIVGTPPSGRAVVQPPTPPPAPPTAVQAAAAAERMEPPAYDVGKDPGWKGLLPQGNHGLENILNGMSPEERQILQMHMSQLLAAQPPSTSRAPGTI